jgi:lambda family phage tail tape measure protein
MAIISRLAVLLGLDAGEFNAGLGKAKDKVEGFSAAAKVGLLAVSGSFIALGRSAVQYAEQISQVAQANDTAIHDVLALNEALLVAGGGADSAGKLFAAFNNKIDEAASGSDKTRAVFQKLGVSLTDISNLPTDRLLEKTLKQLSQIPDSATRSAKTVELLGRAMRGLDVREVYEELMAAQGKYTADMDKSFFQVKQTMDVLTSAFTDLKTAFIVSFGPAIEGLIVLFTKLNWAIAGTFSGLKDIFTLNFDAIKNWDFGVGKEKELEEKLRKIREQKPPSSVEVSRPMEAGELAKKQKEALKKQQEFYERELLITQAKNERLKKENELAFLTQNERNLQLELFDIEQKRQQLTLGDQFGRKMSQEQANAWAEAEKARAKEAYQIAESQRSFEFGWKKAFATYADNATNAAQMGEQAFVSVTQNMEQALDTFVNTGKLKFGDLARSIIADLIKIQMRAQLLSLFKGFSSIFGFGGGDAGMFTGSTGAIGGSIHIGTRAGGGDIMGGMPYLVGEEGPELVVPKNNGTVIPNHQLGSAMGNQPQVVYNGPYIANMSAIDTQSGLQFLAKNKQGVWASYQSAQRSLPQSR